MRKTTRFTLILGVLLGLAGLAVLVEFILSRGRTPRLPDSRSIASLEQLPLGGVTQWILIRGRDSTNPVLLFLHGGPGMPAMFLAHAFQPELERDFVVVHWDRRGAGKSYRAAESASLSVSQTLEDIYQLTSILRDRFHQDRIYLVGHSWGSYLGLLAIRGRPEWYGAFVGMGQLAGTVAEVGEIRREFLAREASKAGDRERSLQFATGDREATEEDLFRYGGELHGADSYWPILKTGLFAPEYTLLDILNVKRGAEFVSREMEHDVIPRPHEGEIAAVDVPIAFFLGRYDYNTPSQLAAEYLDRVDAPSKTLVWFDSSSHFPFFEEPGRFHTEMVRFHHTARAFWALRTD